MSEQYQKSALTDEDVVALVQRGDSEKFGILIERYNAKLLRYGTRFLSNQDDIIDIVQDIFVRAYRSIQSFDTTLRFSPWIYRIAHNTFVNALRARGKSAFISLDLDTFVSPLDLGATSPQEEDRELMRKIIDEGLAKISSKYREVLILYYFEELPYTDIADILHIPVSTVGIRLLRAKKELKKNIDPSVLTL